MSVSREVCHQPPDTNPLGLMRQALQTFLTIPPSPNADGSPVLRFFQTEAVAVTTWSPAVGQGQLADSLSPSPLCQHERVGG